MFGVLRRSGLLLAVAAAVFALAVDNGSFSLSARSALAIAVWWAVIVAVGMGAWPRARVPRTALVAGGLFAAFALWTLASAAWAPSTELAFVEFDRTTLYLGVFLVAVLAGTRNDLARWIDGLAAGLVPVAALALASRFFPSLVGDERFLTYLPAARERLSYPVQYWNGLGILTALAFPLLLRRAVACRASLARGIALAPAPLLAATVYLTSSRGAVAAALAAALVVLALARRRWRTLGAIAVAAVSSAAAAAVVEATSDGVLAAAALLLLCVATGTTWGLVSRATTNPPRRLGRGLAAAAGIAVLAALVAGNPGRRWDSFTRPPTVLSQPAPDFTRAHLFSGSGSGRWQFWTAAADEWRSAPVQGRGAGSFQSWWAQHGSIAYFVRDAHSLYVETAGELGLVGLALLLAALGCGGAAAVSRARRADEEGVAAIAALGGAFAGYLVGVGVDWMWELTIVSLVGIVSLGLLVGPATEPLQAAGGPLRHRFALGAAIVAAGWLALFANAVPLLAEAQLRASERAAARGDETTAIARALTARKLEPWASTPYLQLALVAEQAHDYTAAREWALAAAHRDPEDWRPWLVEARIETEAGNVPAARRALRTAAALDPRSPLFAGVSPGSK